jgi:hypothetical protein
MNTKESQYALYTDDRGISMELPQSLRVCECSWCSMVMTRGSTIKVLPKLHRLVAVGLLGEIGGEYYGRPVCVMCKKALNGERRGAVK